MKINANIGFVNKRMAKKMRKSARKKKKIVLSTKNLKNQSKAAEYVGYLMELHKLQGVLLTRLNKEIS